LLIIHIIIVVAAAQTIQVEFVRREISEPVAPPPPVVGGEEKEEKKVEKDAEKRQRRVQELVREYNKNLLGPGQEDALDVLDVLEGMKEDIEGLQSEVLQHIETRESEVLQLQTKAEAIKYCHEQAILHYDSEALKLKQQVTS
jgi:hypothetical protein